MTSNMDYIGLEDYIQTAKLPMFETKKSFTVFLRFLKDNGLFCLYKRNFNDFAYGREYRRKYTDFCEEDNLDMGLIEFCNRNIWKWFIIDAFKWDNNEFWYNVHSKWVEYCMKQHEIGLI